MRLSHQPGVTNHLHKALLIAIVICLPGRASAQLSFAQSEIPAIGNLSPTSLKPGDFDSDGDLDLLVQYYDTPSTSWKAQIIENTSVVNSISFIPTAHIFDGAGDFIDWTDFNMDGLLDVFVNGNGTSSIYLRSGPGYNKYSGTITGTSTFKYFEIVDQNNDAQLDVTADKVFLDYDKDGDLDYFNKELFTNRDNYFQKTHTFIDGSSTSLSNGRIPGLVNDFDNNGYLDIAYIEHDGKNSKLNAYVLLNNNKVFTKLQVGYYDSYNGGYYFSTTADFNGNGFPELVLYSAQFGWGGGGGGQGAEIVEIKNGDYHLIHTLPPPVDMFQTDLAASCSGDFDGDGKLDFLVFYKYIYFDINGLDLPGEKFVAYRNTLNQSNTYATAPTGLAAVTNKELVTLSWMPATDDHTLSEAITYNLEIKNGVDQLVMDNRTAGGNLKINKLGNVNQARQVSLRLPNGQYTWSVSAVDGHRIKSTRSVEGSFSVLESTNSVKNIPLTNVAYTMTVEDQILLTGDDSGAIYFQTIESNFGSKIDLPVQVNTNTTSNSEPKISYNAVGEQFIVIWRGSTAAQPNKLWGRVFNKNVVPVSAEFLISDPEASGLSVEDYAVCYNKARNNYRVVWSYRGVGGLGMRTTTINPSNFAIAPIVQFRDGNDFSELTNFFDETLLSVSPDGNSMLLAYSTVDYPMYGLQDGRYTYLELLDADFVNKVPQIVIVDATPRSICYNTLNSTFGIGWDKYHYRNNPNSAAALIRNSEVQAGFLHSSDGSPLHIIEGLSSSFVQGGSGGAIHASMVYNSVRNENLLIWYNTVDGRVHGRRINPITRSAIEIEEFLISNFSGSNTQATFIPEHNQFALSFGSQFSMFTLAKDPRPVVNSISLNKASAGTTLIITGTGFGNTPIVNKVKFGTSEAVVDPVFPVANDPTKIRVTVPTGLGRSIVPVTVTFDGQESEATVLFENIDNTSVTSITPLVGALGETITIKGVNFPTNKADITVMFGESAATATDVVSIDGLGTEIKVKVPQNAIRGSGQTVGVVIQGVLNNYAGGTFRVIRPPAVETVDAIEGLISRKTIVINGADFSNNKSDLTVKLGSFVVQGKDFISASNTALTIRIPSGVEGNVAISVLTDDRLGVSEQNYSFILGSTVKSTVPAVSTEFNFTARKDDDIDFKVEVYNRQAVQAISFVTKGISEGDADWKSKLITNSADGGNKIEFNMPEAEFTADPIGLHFFFEVLDSSGIEKYSDTLRVYRNYPEADSTNLIPNLRFGGSVADYQIVSIPYDLEINKITSVFKDLFNAYGYDKSKWRIFHYNTNIADYNEYLDGLDAVSPGQGYWLISRYPQDIFFEGARTLDVDNGYYEIPLKAGWNQIGNPYNFNVSWNDIMTFNGNPTTIESFKTFKDGAFQAATTIDRFRGGFVHAGSDFNLKIPVTQNKGINGGRMQDQKPFISDLSKKVWRLALELKAGDLRNTLGSFGMHPQSEDGEDERDEHRLPNFIQTLDFAFPGSLATSIVGTQESYSWEFEVFNTTESVEVTLRWDNTSFGDNDRELYLHDRVEERLIDMREKNSYTFTFRPGYTFNLHFGDRTYVERKAQPEHVVLSDAYPNPMSNRTTIPFTVMQDNTHVQLSIYNLQGQAIHTLLNGELASGFYEYDWDGRSSTGGEVPSGVVMYRLQTSSSRTGVQSINKKLIIAP